MTERNAEGPDIYVHPLGLILWMIVMTETNMMMSQSRKVKNENYNCSGKYCIYKEEERTVNCMVRTCLDFDTQKTF